MPGVNGEGTLFKMNQKVLEGFSVEIDRGEVERLLGGSGAAREKQAERLEKAMADGLAEAGRLIEPRGIYRMAAGRDLPGSTIFESLERMAFCVCTIGPAIEERVSELSSLGNLLDAVILDSAGSVAAEAVAGHMDDAIKAIAAEEGLKTSCRASPGYGDWDVGEQRALFALVDGARIGVTLSPGGMMIPRKSISFAIHMDKKPERLRSEESCRNCDMETCRYRTRDPRS